MDCEAEQAKKESTAQPRSLLLRVEHRLPVSELRDHGRRISEAGFDGIELPLNPRVSDEEQPWTEDELSAVASAREEPPKVVTVAARCTATDPQAAFDELSGRLELAASLGGQCLALTLPPVEQPSTGRGFARYQDALNFAHVLLLRLRHGAEATGVVLALEAAANGWLLSPVEMRELIDAANSWAVGVCVDLARIARVGLPADWLTTLRHRVQAVRLTESDLSAEVTPPGVREPVAIDAIATVLDQISYDRPVIVTGSAPLDDMRRRAACLVSSDGMPPKTS